MKKLVLATAALAAAVVVFAVVTRPAAHLTLTAEPDDGSVAGISHVHTVRSDGRGTPDEIAAAAARAGLKFVIFSDHGDATRPPDPPVYRSGMLCLDGVEISTTGGHYVAIDMPAAPYPLAGEPRDVVEDVRRLGGFGIAAHPDSPKPALRWREWTAPFDALEALNPDTSWRHGMQAAGWRPKLHLAEALLHYPLRPAETIAGLLQPSDSMYQWNALAQRRRVVLVSGADAHASIGFRTNGDSSDVRYSLPLPGYEATFRTMSLRVKPDRPLTGEATADAAALVRAIRSGHLYTAVDGVATPPSFEFTASNAAGNASAGDELGTGGPVTLRVRSNAPAGFTTTIFAGMTPLTVDTRNVVEVQAPPAPNVYRVEVHPPGGGAPWIVSNAIYVRAPQTAVKLPERPPAKVSDDLFDGKSTHGWQVETDGKSAAALETAGGLAGPEMRMRFGLANDPNVGEFVAMVYTTPNGVAPNNRITFHARAERPMRISVQLRNWAPGYNERWQRSVYVDSTDREHTIFFDDLTPVGETKTWRPGLADIRNVIFTIDTTNTKPGTSGRLWISKVALQR